MDERKSQREFEDQFLGQLRARAIALAGTKLPADDVIAEATDEGVDSARAELSRLASTTRTCLKRFPVCPVCNFAFRRRSLADC